jgi:hypothetical protein
MAQSAESQHPVLDAAAARVSPHDIADAIVVEVADADRD